MYKFLCGCMFAILLGYLGVESLGHMVTLYLTSKDTIRLFSKVNAPLTFLPAVCEGSNFSTSSSTLVNICLTDCHHLTEYEVISHVILICISLMANDIEHLLVCILANCISFGKDIGF